MPLDWDKLRVFHAAAQAHETVGTSRVGERIFEWLVRRLGL